GRRVHRLRARPPAARDRRRARRQGACAVDPGPDRSRRLMALTILEGSTFCICDERGDIDAETQGLFTEDTRFLSLLRLTINGAKPLLLSSGVVEYFSAAFFLRNPAAGGIPTDTLSVTRERFVGEGMQDRIVVRNEGMEPVSFELAL